MPENLMGGIFLTHTVYTPWYKNVSFCHFCIKGWLHFQQFFLPRHCFLH